MSLVRIIEWVLFGLAILFFCLLWGGVAGSATLSYIAVRDATVVNLFFALFLGALILGVGCGYKEKLHTHEVWWFLYISMVLGIYNLNRLPPMVYGELIKGAAWSDVPLTGLFAALQTLGVLFALLSVLVEYFIFHRKQ